MKAFAVMLCAFLSVLLFSPLAVQAQQTSNGGRISVTLAGQCQQGTVVQIIDPASGSVVATLSPNAAGTYDSGCTLPCPRKYIVKPVNPSCTFTPAQQTVGVRCCPEVTKVKFTCICSQNGGRIVVGVPPNCVAGTTVQILDLSGNLVMSGPLNGAGLFDTGCKLKCQTSYVVKISNPSCTFTPSSKIVQVSCCPAMSTVRFDCKCPPPRGRIIAMTSQNCPPGTVVSVYDANNALVASGTVNAQGLFDTGCDLPCGATYTVTATNPQCSVTVNPSQVVVSCCPDVARVTIDCDCPPPPRPGRIVVRLPETCTPGTTVSIVDSLGNVVTSGSAQLVQLPTGLVAGEFDSGCVLVCGQTYHVTATNPNCRILPPNGIQVQAACCPDATTVNLDCDCPPPPKGRLTVTVDAPCAGGGEVTISDATGNVVTTGTLNAQGFFDTNCTLPCPATYNVTVTNAGAVIGTQSVNVGCCPDFASVTFPCPPPPPQQGRIVVHLPANCTSGTVVQVVDPAGQVVSSGSPVLVPGTTGALVGEFDTSCTLVCGQTYTVVATNPVCTIRPAGGVQVQAGCCPNTATVNFDCDCPQANCVQPPAGMVAWYPLDEPLGTATYFDLGGSVQNNGVPSPAVPPQATVGKVGGAQYFFGNGNYVQVAPHAELDFGTGSFSLDAWVKLVGCSPSHLYPVVEKYDGTNQKGFSFYLLGDTMYLVMNGTTYASNSSLGMSFNTWHHVAVVVSRPAGGSATGTFYLNGTAVGTFAPLTASVDTVNPLFIGRNFLVATSSHPHCEIAIDELELFNVAVAAADIAAIYQADTAGKCKPTLGR
ncbi:MAG: LamG domain-containing protein, partial [Candidatus Sumerlaeaceae bacterium]|nr:LamG domain-containing protein [Candidatus Sumerlaeaceae bacterium]